MSDKAQKIHKELRQAGMTKFGLLKFASHRLTQVLHSDEEIRGIVYGRYSQGRGFMQLNEGMLIATNKRIIFLDRKPGFETIDELTYHIVFGVKKVYAWPFCAMTLQTRIGNFTIRYANSGCIDKFMHYVESRQLESNEPLACDRGHMQQGSY